ncbi:MAG: alpha/beta hydrolase [Sphingomicrobium sp.]
MAAWQDKYWNSADGLRLHYRDYAGPHERAPLLCIPGLTRNAADFEPVADHVAGQWRVIAVDLRGRGLSENDPKPERYSPPAYAADLMKLLDQLGIADAVFVGTSLGGLVTMVIAATDSERIAGALLNDIGPDVDAEGIDRIAGYVGTDTRFATWDDIVASLKARNGDKFPRWDDAAWHRLARRTARETGGTIGFAYDMAIADYFDRSRTAPVFDAWPLWRSLVGRPVTLLHGEISDLLSAATARRMIEEVPDAELVVVPDVGHAPSLEEPESLAALDRLLARVLAAA